MKSGVLRTGLFVALMSSVAAALGTDSLGLATKYNAVIFGTTTLHSGDIDGALAVGGNLDVRNSFVASALASAPKPSFNNATNLGVYVRGNVYGASHLHVNSGRNLYAGGSVSGSPRMNGGGLARSNSPYASNLLFTQQKSYSQTQSAYLKSLGGSAVDTSNSNNYKAVITKTGGLNVFTIDASKLSGGKTLDVVGGNGHETLVFNVTGGSFVNWGTNYNGNAKRTLWNFANATQLDIKDRLLRGSVLAVNANVDMTCNVDGTMIANALKVSSGAELHTFTFEGNAPVPEPMTLVALGLGAAALIRRKRS
jgi:choice-of-anchor A domain-containing protein